MVGYAGSMGLPNALDVLLDAAALLRDEPIAIVLVGDGLERARAVLERAGGGAAVTSRMKALGIGGIDVSRAHPPTIGMAPLLFPAPLALAAGDGRQVPPEAALPLGVRMPLLEG